MDPAVDTSDIAAVSAARTAEAAAALDAIPAAAPDADRSGAPPSCPTGGTISLGCWPTSGPIDGGARASTRISRTTARLPGPLDWTAASVRFDGRPCGIPPGPSGRLDTPNASAADAMSASVDPSDECAATRLDKSAGASAAEPALMSAPTCVSIAEVRGPPSTAATSCTIASARPARRARMDQRRARSTASRWRRGPKSRAVSPGPDTTSAAS
mmetsp:Transcript_25928/g.97684  ORF Transcript_25928/g.97684 Transcript_25928/m.97684 type:complete len:214 (+) Transcript_25928:1387-2028(+)